MRRSIKYILTTISVFLLIGILSFLLRDLPFLKYKFLYGADSLGHFWFAKIIVDYGYLYPNSIEISYSGDTGWYTGYAPYFGQHVLQAETSILTGIPLEKLYFNLNALVSTLWMLPIYLITKIKTKNQFKAVASTILTAFWFYFVFHSWMGTYEIVSTFFFLILIYLTERGDIRYQYILEISLVTALIFTHHLTTLAMIVYLATKYVLYGSRKYITYLTYTSLVIYVAGLSFSRIGIGFGGLYLAKHYILIVPLATAIAEYVVRVVGILGLFEKFLNLVEENKNILFLLAIAFYLTSVMIIAIFGKQLSVIHYAFGSELIMKYILGLTPIIILAIWVSVSRASKFRDEIIVIIAITTGFAIIGALKGMYFMIPRSIGFISPFLILMLSDFCDKPYKIGTLVVASLLMLYPTIPSYFYSDEIDRPYYPISEEYLQIINNKKIENSNSIDPIFKYISKIFDKYKKASSHLIKYNSQKESVDVISGLDRIYTTKIQNIKLKFKLYNLYNFKFVIK